MKIYLAARHDRRFQMLGVGVDLMRAGHEVTSTWIENVHGTPPTLLGPARNLIDLGRADCMVTYTEPPEGNPLGSARGGLRIEFGVALATGKRLCIVGPREDVLHHLPQVEIYATTAELIAALARPTKGTP
jgi:hypothetical protein